jgi:hypothetical protein
MSWRLALLCAAFALHNLEEVYRFEAWQGMEFGRPKVDAATFEIAVMLLTVIVAIVFVAAGWSKLRGAWEWVVAIIAGGLIVNAAGHLLMSLMTVTLVPGVLTGVILVAPSAIWVLAWLDGDATTVRRRWTLAVLYGAVAMPVVALAALWCSEALRAWLA